MSTIEEQKKMILDQISRHDNYIFYLIQWANKIESLVDRIRFMNRDEELRDELFEIQKRLIREIGMRTYLTLRGKKND